jgi:dipeptidyl-peptidase-4
VPFLATLLLTALQSDLPKHPRYAAYTKARTEIPSLDVKVNTTFALGFSADSKYVLLNGGKRMDLATGVISETPPDTGGGFDAGGGRRGQGSPGRGRQFTSAQSPDGKLTARYANSNITLETPNGNREVTKDGSVQARIKYGTASWVYGEELSQNQAMWWTADSKTLVYYRFDESKVLDYHLTLKQNAVQDELYTEAYPKAGAPNPTVQLWAYDVANGASKQIDTTFASTDADIAQYVYNVRFAPDGQTLLFNRTNRKQNVMELCASDLANGKSRVVIQESNPNGWVDNSPRMTWLKDGKSFLWLNERNGFANFWLGSLDKGLIAKVTDLKAEVDGISKLDEDRKVLWYTAHDGENPYLIQLHRVGLDGKGDKRVTDPSLGHMVTVSTDGTKVLDRASKMGVAPFTRVLSADGKVLRELGKGDLSGYAESGYKPAERFMVMGSDGVTPVYGYFCKPRDFDPSKKYPMLLRVYGGPESGSGREAFKGADAVCELGFITAWIDAKGTSGRGRDFTQAVYRKLGVVEIDDTAAAVTNLCKANPWIDPTRVGVEGTSYGGYFSATALVRHPEVFAAACASSSVTSWIHYDSIYTERYMDTPQNNPEGYKAGSAMEYVKDLTGKLCLFYGTADDNVHPSNTHQLIAALDRANKPYRLYVGVDQGHAGLRQDRQLEFFIEALKP